jgi:hypothetical protein
MSLKSVLVIWYLRYVVLQFDPPSVLLFLIFVDLRWAAELMHNVWATRNQGTRDPKRRLCVLAVIMIQYSMVRSNSEARVPDFQRLQLKVPWCSHLPQPLLVSNFSSFKLLPTTASAMPGSYTLALLGMTNFRIHGWTDAHRYKHANGFHS